MTSYSIKSLSLCLFFLASTTFAENVPVKEEKVCCPDGMRHFRAGVRHIEKGGIGYEDGYTTLEGFFAGDPSEWAAIPFADLRGHVFDDGRLAANLGGGIRTTWGQRVYGINGYFDYRRTDRFHSDQIGAGLETLGEVFDIRINGYLPLGRKVSSPYGLAFGGFRGNELLQSLKYQFAMRGIDAEFGLHLGNWKDVAFYAAAGPYYFNGKLEPSTWGGKLRISGTFKDLITFEISDSYDKTFHNKFQGQVGISFSFGPKSKVETSCDFNTCELADTITTRMLQPVARQEIIVIDKKRKKSPAIDPATGRPFVFIFVNNTSSSNGTIESPYHTLAQAQANSAPNNIIYVFPGDGTTTGMDMGITLQASQKFWGSGVSHTLRTAQGNITIPAKTTTSPTITNIAGDAIDLATNNGVSGFIIESPSGYGISGTNSQNVCIASSTITGSQLDQIHLEYSAAPGTLLFSNLTLTNGVASGIVINSTASSMPCTVNNCVIQDNASFSIDTSFANGAAFTLTNNTIVGNGASSNLDFGGPATLLATGNTFNNNTSMTLAPLFVTAAASPLSASIENNTISGNACGAIHFVLNDTNSAQLAIANNTIANNGTGSIGASGSTLVIDPNTTSTGNCNLSLAHNTLTGNAGSGLYCSNGSFNNFVVTAAGNELNDNGASGCVFDIPCTTFTLIATNNTIANGGDNGIVTSGGITMTTATMSLSNNQIVGNTTTANGVAINHEGTTFNFIATGNNISGNANSGIFMFSSGVIDTIVATIEGNTIDNNQNMAPNTSGGVDIEQFNNLSGSFLDNTLSNNAVSGVFIGSAASSPNVCLEMIGNNSTGDYVFSSGTGVFNLTPCDVDMVNTGTITAIGTVTLVQSCPDATPCPP